MKSTQLSLPIKDRLQFLNTLCLNSQNFAMLFSSKGNKVNYAVIRFNPIQMMNDPTLRQVSPVCLLPNQYMLKHSSVTLSSIRMVWAINSIIAQGQSPTPFPIPMVTPSPFLILIFGETRSTPFRPSINSLPAITTNILLSSYLVILLLVCPSFFYNTQGSFMQSKTLTRFTKFSSFIVWLSTLRTRCNPIIPHTYIITQIMQFPKENYFTCPMRGFSE